MSILFFIKKSTPKKNGKCTIMIRLTLDGEQAHFSSKLEVEPQNWDQKNNKAKSRTKGAASINNLLENVRLNLYCIYNDLLDSKIRVTPSKIKCAFIGQGEQTTLAYIFREHITHLRKRIGINLSEVTCQKYEKVLERIIQFTQATYERDNIQINKVDLRFVELLFLFLRKHRSYSHNTSMKYMQKLAAVMNYAERTGVVEHNPFIHYKIHFKQAEPVSLSQAEVDRMYDKKFRSQRLSEVRDMFIFCCYTGLSFTDLYSLKLSDIQTVFDDDISWIQIRRIKTDIPSHIPLLPIPCEIVRKYQVSHSDGHRLFPVKSNQKTNEYLKEIADLCEIEKNLIFHTARHTFAGLMLNYGVSLTSLSRMMGHRNIRTTQAYARITDRRIKEEMTLVQNRFCK